MKKQSLLIGIAVLAVALLVIAAAKRISDLPTVLTLADTNIFETAFPGVTNSSSQVTFGTLASNLASRFPVLNTPGATSPIVLGAGTNQQIRLDTNGNITLGASASFNTTNNGASVWRGSLVWYGAAQYANIQPTADGVLLFRNGNSSHFTRLSYSSSVVGPALSRSGAGFAVTGGDGTFNPTNHLIIPGAVFATNGVNTPAAILTATTTAPAFTAGFGGHVFSDGTNLLVVLENAAGARTTNKLTLAAWP